MFGFDDAKKKRDEIYDGQPHESKISHELIGGGAAFEAMKLFEDRQRKEGKTVNHAFAKEMLVGIAGAEVDKLFETKGLDYMDREKAKHQAKKQAEEMYDHQYGDQEEYDPNNSRRHPSMDY
ncbi:hypothetical protein F4821DRAFT_231330 [Hypoxylon rubiginosum]|uniref:Uncharacterized protein n=1 Tax=Hypoxylon rubiginosum TaxID=110542 RepID=A0ACC0D9Y5_9PEZI|nr:hypothetical protein F4821DRAFT_231330 [Hypoxylon rubiginosum]